VDSRLAAIADTLVDRFDRIDYSLGRLDARVDEVEATLLDLMGATNRLEGRTAEWLTDASNQDLILGIKLGLGYEARTGARMPYDLFVQLENLFQTNAVNFSKDSIRAGPSVRSYAAGDILGELDNFPLDVNGGYVVNVGPSLFQLPPPPPPRVANP